MEIRALRPTDDRSSFQSGDEALDRFFHQYAGQNQFRHHLGITYVAAARTLDFVIYGLEEFTAITIVSPQSAAIRARITGELERGVTVYKGYGGLSGAEQDILYCVVTRLEIGKVKAIVRALDASAFVVSHPLADAEGGVVKRASLH